VGIASVGGYVLVLTEKYPYQVSGNNPATMAFARIDTLYPCVSKRSIVNMGYGVLYPTYGGVALFSSEAGAVLATKSIHDILWAKTMGAKVLRSRVHSAQNQS